MKTTKPENVFGSHDYKISFSSQRVAQVVLGLPPWLRLTSLRSTKIVSGQDFSISVLCTAVTTPSSVSFLGGRGGSLGVKRNCTSSDMIAMPWSHTKSGKHHII